MQDQITNFIDIFSLLLREHYGSLGDWCLQSRRPVSTFSEELLVKRPLNIVHMIDEFSFCEQSTQGPHITTVRLHDEHGIWMRGITLMKMLMPSVWRSPVYASHNRDGLTSRVGILALCYLGFLLLWKWALPVLECKLLGEQEFLVVLLPGHFPST